MLDDLQVAFWSITYILIICAGFKSQKFTLVSMPYVAGVLNFGWETIALFCVSKGNVWGHIFWFGLDLVIVYISYKFLNSDNQRKIYIASIFAMTIILFFIFKIEGGMLYSVFAIDLIMAVCYLVWRKQMSPHFKIPVAITKLIGDLFAGIFYAKESKFVAIVAVAVFLCNVSYLIFCIVEYKTTDKKEYYKLKKHETKRKRANKHKHRGH